MLVATVRNSQFFFFTINIQDRTFSVFSEKSRSKLNQKIKEGIIQDQNNYWQLNWQSFTRPDSTQFDLRLGISWVKFKDS